MYYHVGGNSTLRGAGVHHLLAFILLLPIALLAESPAVHGVKIYYGDGKVVKIAAAEMPKGWLKAPADNVQVVRVYYERKYSADGQERRYADTIEGKDFYWWSPTKGFGTTDFVAEIPSDAPTVKIGRLLPDGEFLKLYNKAHNDHAF